MRIDLSGRTALVTGSSAGIGNAIAAGLAGCGAEVVVNARTAGRVEEGIGSVREHAGAEAALRGVAADVGTAAGCDELIEAVPDIDILVNNVGAYELMPFFEITDEDWQRLFEVNVMSGVRLARHYTPRMVEKGWGRVIFISSESALHIPAEMVHYGMTKTAQLAVSRGLAESVPGSGVTVNSVLPGPTSSEGARRMMADGGEPPAELPPEFMDARPTSLLGRPSTPEEVANMVVYVASEQASATTGAALRVDGGVVRAIP